MDPPEEEVKSLPCPWKVEEPDEARYNFSDQKGVWQPKPEDILSVFEQLAKGGALPLKWTCPGRRAPESDTPNENEAEMEMEMAEDQSQEDYNDPEPSAFDFDDSLPDTNTKVTPWRAHAGRARTPKTEKRVARMDNIMDSLRKQQNQRAAEREAARKSKGGTPSRVQQGRGRLIKFGSPLSKKNAGSAPPISSLFGASSPSDPTDPGTGKVSTSPSSTAASSSTVTQSSMNSAPPNASTPVLAHSHSGAPGLKLQRQDLKNDVNEENPLNGQQRSEERDSRHEESVQATSAAMVSSSSAALASPHSSFITISSDAQKWHTTTASSLPGLGYQYQSSEQKFETSAGQVTSENSVITASSDGDVKTSSNPTSSLVTAATSSSFSLSTSVPQKTPSSNSNGSASKPSSSSYSNTLTGLTKTEESMAESSTVVSSASGSMAVSVNESSGQMTSFGVSSSTDVVTQSHQSGAQTEWVKSSESISFPATVNPSQASAMPEPSLPKND